MRRSGGRRGIEYHSSLFSSSRFAYVAMLLVPLWALTNLRHLKSLAPFRSVYRSGTSVHPPTSPSSPSLMPSLHHSPLSTVYLPTLLLSLLTALYSISISITFILSSKWLSQALMTSPSLSSSLFHPTHSPFPLLRQLTCENDFSQRVAVLFGDSDLLL